MDPRPGMPPCPFARLPAVFLNADYAILGFKTSPAPTGPSDATVDVTHMDAGAAIRWRSAAAHDGTHSERGGATIVVFPTWMWPAVRVPRNPCGESRLLVARPPPPPPPPCPPGPVPHSVRSVCLAMLSLRRGQFSAACPCWAFYRPGLQLTNEQKIPMNSESRGTRLCRQFHAAGHRLFEMFEQDFSFLKGFILTLSQSIHCFVRGRDHDSSSLGQRIQL